MKIWRSISIVILCGLVSSFSCSRSEKVETEIGAWKGHIEDENGIDVFVNPVTPILSEVEYDLEEDLSIGNEDDDNYLFYGAFDIAVDQDENIFVLEYKNCRIQKFSREGEYLQTIGRQGQGPGEFERPSELSIDVNTGNLCVRDSRELVLFNRDGDYADGTSFRDYPMDFMFDPEGNVWGKFSIIGAEGLTYAIGLGDLEGTLTRKIAEYPMMSTQFSRGEASMMLTHGYEHDLYFAPVDGQTFVYGFSDEYKLFLTGPGGAMLRILKKDEPEIPFSGDMQSKIKKRYTRLSKSELDAFKFPATFPYFAGIFSDDTGRIYVKMKRSPLTEDESFVEYDVFSREGHFLFKTQFPKDPKVIKNGFYYVIEADEESGLELVKRYRIVNWAKLISGI